MRNKQIESFLRALRAEIAKISDLDEASEEKLNGLIDGMKRKLANPDDHEQHQELLSRLQSAIRHFEVSNPELTETLNGVMITLSNMGI